MIKAILFDLDGTLLNTLPDIAARVNEMLAHFSYPPISTEAVRSYIGDGAEKLVERAIPQGAKNLGECYAYFRENFVKSGELTTLFEGEEDALRNFIRKGYLLAIVTNKPQDATEALIKKFFPEIPFAFVGGDSGLFPCKPDPTLARYAALTMRVSLSECLFVGDGETDARTAHAAGMRHVAVLWGYRTKEQLSAAGATVFARTFSELEKILENEEKFS